MVRHGTVSMMIDDFIGDEYEDTQSIAYTDVLSTDSTFISGRCITSKIY